MDNKIKRYALLALRSVEFPLFLYFFAITLFQSAQKSLITAKMCLYKFDNEAFCEKVANDDNDNEPALQHIKQVISDDFGRFLFVSQLCNNIPLVVMAIMHGSMCDRFSHKAGIISSHLGNAVLTAIYMIYSALPAKVMYPGHMAYSSLLVGFSGSWAVISLVSFAYACRTTNPTSRTIRLATMQASATGGQIFGYFLNFLGFRNYIYPFDLIFTIQIAIHLFAIVHVILHVPELHTKEEVQDRLEKQANGNWLKFVWVPKENFPAVFKIFFGKHSDGRPIQATRFIRVLFISYLFTSMILGFKSLGTVIEQFLRMPPISMTDEVFSLFQGTYSIVATVGLLTIPIFKAINFSDAGIAEVGLVIKMLSLVILGFGDVFPRGAHWIYALMSIFAMYPLVAIRAGMSKLAADNKQGRLFAVLVQAENFMSVIARNCFEQLFDVLTKSKPVALAAYINGYTFFFAAGMLLLPIVMIGFVARRYFPNWSFHQTIIEHDFAYARLRAHSSINFA